MEEQSIHQYIIFFRAAVGSIFIFIFDLEFGMDSHFFGGVVVVELS